MTAVDDAISDVLERVGLTQRATVYTGSSWATVATTDLPCSLDPAPRAPAVTGAGRTDLASRGVFEWQKDYTMPVGARVTVDAYGAQRWSVVAGTIWPSFGPGGARISWTCEVIRAN